MRALRLRIAALAVVFVASVTAPPALASTSSDTPADQAASVATEDAAPSISDPGPSEYPLSTDGELITEQTLQEIEGSVGASTPSDSEDAIAEEAAESGVANSSDRQDLVVSDEQDYQAVRSEPSGNFCSPGSGILALETHGEVFTLESKSHADPTEFITDPSEYKELTTGSMPNTNPKLTNEEIQAIFGGVPSNYADAGRVARNDGLDVSKEDGRVWGFLTGGTVQDANGTTSLTGPVYIMPAPSVGESWGPKADYLVLVRNLGVNLMAGASYKDKYYFGGFYQVAGKPADSRFRVFEYDPAAQQYPVRILGDLPISMLTTAGFGGMEFDAQGNLYILTADRNAAEYENRVELYTVPNNILEQRWRDARFGYQGDSKSRFQSYFTDMKSGANLLPGNRKPTAESTFNDELIADLWPYQKSLRGTPRG